MEKNLDAFLNNNVTPGIIPLTKEDKQSRNRFLAPKRRKPYRVGYLCRFYNCDGERLSVFFENLDECNERCTHCKTTVPKGHCQAIGISDFECDAVPVTIYRRDQ